MPIAVEFVDGPCYLWFAATLGHEVYSSVHQVEGVISSLIIWHKTNATYSAMRAHYKQRHEVCLYWRPKGSTMRWTGPSDACSLWEIGREAVNKLHPTQKPIELAATAIRNHDAQVVFDPFSGSGTVTMACESLGRQCRAIEVNPTYVDVAIARWRQSSGADPILQATGETFDAVRQRRLAERGLSGA
jgi:DNA modification methylase